MHSTIPDGESDVQAGSSQDAKPSRRARRKWLSNPLTHLVIAFAVLSLLQAFVVKQYVVPSASMETTLTGGDRILVNRIGNSSYEPITGDVLVFNANDQWRPARVDEPAWKSALRWVSEVTSIGPGFGRGMVKRVLAGPGQSVSCCSNDGAFFIDGTELNEPYVYNDHPFVPGATDCSTSPVSTRCIAEFTVPEGQFVVLGDNRGNSSDSLSGCRGQPATAVEAGCVRFVGRDDVVGPVLWIVWPLGRLGGVE